MAALLFALMKLTHLLEETSPLKKLAFALQQELMELNFIDLDVTLRQGPKGFMLAYHDKHMFVRGHLQLIHNVKSTINPWEVESNGFLLFNSPTELTPETIIFYLFQKKRFGVPAPYVVLSQDIKNTFGINDLEEMDTSNLDDDELYGFTFKPPFKLKFFMVHSKAILGAPGVYIILTKESTIRVYLADQDDETALGEKLGEVTKLADAWRLIKQKIRAEDVREPSL